MQDELKQLKTSKQSPAAAAGIADNIDVSLVDANLQVWQWLHSYKRQPLTVLAANQLHLPKHDHQNHHQHH